MSNKQYNELAKKELYGNANIFRNIMYPDIQKNANKALKKYNDSIKGKERSTIDKINIKNGIIHSSKWKEYIDLIAIMTPEQRSKRFGSTLGKKWFTNGVDDIYLSSDEVVPEGFYAGRSFRKKEYKNHKVAKIEKLNEYKKVYDLEVGDNHNFALDSGVFVHNSVHIEKDRNHNKISRERFFRFSRWCYI